MQCFALSLLLRRSGIYCHVFCNYCLALHYSNLICQAYIMFYFTFNPIAFECAKDTEWNVEFICIHMNVSISCYQAYICISFLFGCILPFVRFHPFHLPYIGIDLIL